MSINAMKQALHVFKEIYEGLGNVKKSDAHKDTKDLATVVRKDCNFAMRDLTQAIEEAEKQETKREWVGLTDEERHDIREWQRIQEELGPVWSPMMLYLYEAIEAKLREKNG
jgi:hypothetical protein